MSGCKLTCFEYCSEIAWYSSFEIHDLNREQSMSSDSSDAFCYFCQWYILLQLFIMRMWPSWNCVIIAPKWGVPNGNHMNDDIAEVNGSAPRMLPGSFLYKKEPGYEATQAPASTFICSTALRKGQRGF